MLFCNRELISVYDFNCEIPDHMLNLNSLSEEVYRITNTIHYLLEKGVKVSFSFTDNNNIPICLNLLDVSEKTWERNTNEIKEILYRNEINGSSQQQFSINKVLKQFDIYKPSIKEEYGRYLQLLYFMYITNYFVFPKKNIFLLLKKENADYHFSYDEGIENGKYLSFILSGLMLDKEVLESFNVKTHALYEVMDEVSLKVKNLLIFYDFSEIDEYIGKKVVGDEKSGLTNNNDENVLIKLADYCHNYGMYAYASDLLVNLMTDEDIFKFNKPTINPPNSWKQRYVRLDEIDEFILSNEVYSFCKQSDKKIEVRDKLKFAESGSVRFLKNLIEYDLNWMADFKEENDGLIIQKYEGDCYIYALRLAVIIKTYDDLVNKLKTRLKSGKKQSVQPLRSALASNWSFNSILPATLPVRYFLLAAHAEYQNVITKDNYYDLFKHEYIYPEILVMKLMQVAYSRDSISEVISFLKKIF